MRATRLKSGPVNDYLALIKALVLAPGDVTARLALADWLEEHGEGGPARPLRCPGWWTSQWDHVFHCYYLRWHVHPADYKGGRTGLDVFEMRRKEAPRCLGVVLWHEEVAVHDGTPRRRQRRKVPSEAPCPCPAINHLTAGPKTRWLWLCQGCCAVDTLAPGVD